MSLPAQILIGVAAFAGGSLVAEAFGAANLGTALGFGQIAFALAMAWLLVRA
jgi:hypothetical protein